jgi:hypothetical protein
MTFGVMFFLMLAGHYVADRPLQPGWLSQFKRDPDFRTRWKALLLHAFPHGFFVSAITGHWWLGAFEVAAHAIIDRTKGRGLIGMKTDQGLHVACKALWVAIVAVAA